MATTECTELARWPPEPLDPCPYCQQTTDCVVRLYSIKTKRRFSTTHVHRVTYTCRSCSVEARADPIAEQRYIGMYQLNAKYDEITALYETNPRKAIRDLEKLINGNEPSPLIDSMMAVLDKWRKEDPKARKKQERRRRKQAELLDEEAYERERRRRRQETLDIREAQERERRRKLQERVDSYVDKRKRNAGTGTGPPI